MKIVFTLLLCLGFVGCAGIQTKILSLQKGTSEDTAIKIIGQPSNEEDLNSSVTRLIYLKPKFFSNPDEYWLYFEDNKYVFARLHTIFGFYDKLNDMNRLGLISDEDYQSESNEIQQRGLAVYRAIYGQPSYQPAPIQYPIQPTYQRPVLISNGSSYTNCQSSGSNVNCQTTSTSPIDLRPVSQQPVVVSGGSSNTNCQVSGNNINCQTH